MAKDFVRTDLFRTTLQNYITASRVSDYFIDDQGNLKGDPAYPSDQDVWISWTWQEIAGKDSLNFREAFTNPQVITSPQDLDMWVALGKVKISGVISAKVHWLNQEVSEMRFTGTVKDVYDFDYDDNGFAVGSVQIRPKLAAEVQSGHPTLTPGGRVVLTLLNYNDTNLNLTYRFYGL